MSIYLQKSAFLGKLIDNPTHPDLGMIVVIPCFNEPDLISSLQALKNCMKPSCAVEVIVVINSGEDTVDEILLQNLKSYNTANEWTRKNSIDQIQFFLLDIKGLPAKHAGVGLARKIGMDEAVRRFEDVQNQKGLIICFDADSKCETNFFESILDHFQNHPKNNAASIYFEHPIEGSEYGQEIYSSIMLYELHLRYYINAQRYAGFPDAYQTIGSSMVVRSDAYQRQGGMNRRQAGEDFYFLHKFISIGNFGEINTTTVIPSPRPSDRVPFGTGKAVSELISEDANTYLTYNPKTFLDLKTFISLCRKLYSKKDMRSLLGWSKRLPTSFPIFLQNQDFFNKVVEIQSNTSSLSAFRKRFYNWFNAFMLMKYVHFARDNYYPNVPVEIASFWLLNELKSDNGDIFTDSPAGVKELLLEFRKIDRNRNV